MKKVKDPFLISLIILVFSLGVFAYLKYQPRLSKKETSNLFDLPVDKVNRIEIDRNESTTNLIKLEGKWKIENEDVEADEEKIANLIDGLTQLKISETVSVNPDNFSNFGVDQKATKVQLFDGDNKLAEVLVGRAGPSFSKTYFRLPDKDEVYLSNISLRSRVIQTSWLKPSPTPDPTPEENSGDS